MRGIRKLAEDTPKEWASLNFEDISISRELGHAIRQDPAFMMTRDGFTILSMGFNGKRALEWKLKYMEAFYAMEAKLKTPALEAGKTTRQIGVTPPPREDDDMRSLRMQRAVRGFASYWAFINDMAVECAEKTPRNLNRFS